MAQVPTEEVLGRDVHPVTLPSGEVVRGAQVVGKITKNRAQLMWELQFLHEASQRIENAKPKEFERAMEELNKWIKVIGETINRVLNEYGDTDPRHELRVKP